MVNAALRKVRRWGVRSWHYYGGLNWTFGQ